MFLESILFSKFENFKNSVLPCFGDLVKSRASVACSWVIFGDLFTSGRSNREGYSEIFAAQLATLSRVDLPVAKNTWKIFSNFCL